MRKAHYKAYKEKHVVKKEVQCAKENCNNMFVSVHAKKYCLEHR